MVRCALFGMDGVIPFGFNSTVKTEGRAFIATINRLLYDISAGKDLIFVGSQSGSVPYLYNNVNQITIEQMEFIVSVMADIAILCVNVDDEIEYIRRTISAIHGFAGTKVICIGIYPLKYKSNWGFISNVKEIATAKNIQVMQENINRELGLHSFVIDEEYVDCFSKVIIDALSNE